MYKFIYIGEFIDDYPFIKDLTKTEKKSYKTSFTEIGGLGGACRYI
jgi:hypothetical protein